MQVTSLYWVEDDRNDHLKGRPLEEDVVKVNFDGVFCATSHASSVGVVFRDIKGIILHHTPNGIVNR